jgi:predicted amidophosphoribosyltransferase
MGSREDDEYWNHKYAEAICEYCGVEVDQEEEICSECEESDDED